MTPFVVCICYLLPPDLLPDDEELQKIEGLDPKVLQFLLTLRELTKYMEPPEKKTPVKKGKKIKIKA